MAALREKLIRLAHENPGKIRNAILPLLQQEKTAAEPVRADVYIKSRAIFKGQRWPIEEGKNPKYEYAGLLKLGHASGWDDVEVTMQTDGTGGVTDLKIREKRRGAIAEHKVEDAMIEMLISKNWP